MPLELVNAPSHLNGWASRTTRWLKVSLCILVVAVLQDHLIAQATQCTNVATVEAQGVAYSGDTQREALSAATADGLTNAIAQARGAFVSRDTNLYEVLERVLHNGVVTTQKRVTFEQETRTRIAGVVTSFEVLRVDEGERDMTVVQVRASVCLDDRVTIIAERRTAGSVALADHLAGQLERPGLQVVRAGRFDGAESGLLEAALETGATRVAKVSADGVGLAEWRDFIEARLSARMSIIDVRTEAVVLSESFVGLAVGTDQLEAEASAVAEAAIQMARAASAHLTSSAADTVMLVITGVRQPFVHAELEVIVTEVPTVTGLVQASWDDGEGTSSFLVTSNGSACAIGDAIAATRRFLISVAACKGNEATLDVRRAF